MTSRLFWLLLGWLPLLAQAAPSLLPAEEAFRFAARVADPSHIEVRYRIAPGYYLYRDKFDFQIQPAEHVLGAAELPPGQRKRDEFFGDVEIHRGELSIRIPVSPPLTNARSLTLKATSQGCADIGICYPPQQQQAALTLASAPFSEAPAGGLAALLGQETPNAAVDDAFYDSGQVARLLQQGKFWWIVASFFGFGLLLSLTPCMLPMLPIVSGIVAGQGKHGDKRRALILSSSYVLGMSMAYAIAGVAAGFTGSMLAGALQNPWVLGGFAALFVMLALSLFGLYELQPPGFIQSRLSDASNRLHKGHIAGSFGMGALSALIVGSCVAAPLAGALLYIGRSGNGILGGTALFAMGWGMGLPLIAVALSAGALLPKAGPWMESVQRFFGVLLLGAAIWIVAPLLPIAAQMLSWATLLIISAIYLHALDPLPHGVSGWRKLWKGMGIIALLLGAALLVGALSGSRDILQPLSGLRRAAAPAQAASIGFQRVRNSAELDERLRSAGRPAMLDFYADWCVSCKEMERFTFSDPRVRERLAGMLLLQADVTANTPEDVALMKRFGFFGPPGILFFDAQGKELREPRVIGYLPAERFLKVLDSVMGTS